MTFNIYVPSYHRSHRILTAKNLEYCTYVVRKSEEEDYRKAGVENVLAVEDSEIDSAAKVYHWICANTPEDVICICDDDLEAFYYRVDTLDKINDPVTVTREIERLAQLIVDIDIGYLTMPSDMNIKFYDRPFRFSGIPGAMRIYNKAKFKGKDTGKFLYLADIDVELQELLHNRIILIANYFCHKAYIDTNKGGNNFDKSFAEMSAENDVMKNKWGKYFVKANGNSMWRINVPR